MTGFNPEAVKARLAVIKNKIIIAQFADDRVMLLEAELEAHKTVAEACMNDPIICSRIADLLQ